MAGVIKMSEAVRMRPKLKLTPAPVARMRVSKSSGRKNGSQPKKMPLKIPQTATQKRKPESTGVVNQ